MKKIITALCLLMPGIFASAQKQPKQVDIQTKFIEADKHYLQEVGVDLGLPAGNWSDQYSFGIGANYTGNWLINRSFSITGDAGYMYLFGKSVTTYGSPGSFKYPAENKLTLLTGPRITFLPNTAATINGGVALEYIDRGTESAFAWSGAIQHLFPPSSIKAPTLGVEARVGSSGTSRTMVELRIFIVPHIILPKD